MTKEKDLLLKYLCMALPYRVIIHIHDINVEDFDNYLYENYLLQIRAHEIIAKPYLRPMSSMTDEEKREIYDWLVENDVDWFDFSKLRLDEILISFDSSWLLVNWLLEHHFDFMGLIPKGLAIEVIESNNPYKE